MSEFVKQVHNVVKAIPPGKVMSYRGVAEAVGKPRAWRAVGRVLSRNHDPHVPCHRVIRSDGRTGGYNRGSKVKEALLRQEQNRQERRGKEGTLEALQQRLVEWK